MVNSIRDRLSAEDTVSEIKLLLTQDSKKVCILVEGIDDQKLFRPLVSSNSDVLESYASTKGIEEIVHSHFQGNKRVIGIRDRDYLVASDTEQCFFCDYSCAEMMIVSLDSCFDRVYSNHYHGQMDSHEVRLYCLKHLEKLSKLRKLNYTLGWKVNFKGIKPAKYYCKDIDLMNKSIVSGINEMNANNPIDLIREKACNELPPCESAHDYLMITNGHDFLNLFCKVATNKQGQESIRGIETTLRGTFGFNEFKNTVLYKSLLEYQKRNGITIVYEDDQKV